MSAQLSDALSTVEAEAFLRNLVSDPITLAEVTLDAFKELQELRAEVRRLKDVLAGWEQNQREATADSYDEGYTDAAEGREHRNGHALAGELDD